jgi:DNA-binding NtrC family response regulator
MGRILVFERDRELTALFKMVLENEGHAVVIVGTLDDAAAASASAQPDLVLTEAPDLLMQRQAPSAWRAQLADAVPGVPAILCSAVTWLTRTRAAVAGFDGFLEMPFDLADVAAEVNRVLISHARSSPCAGR